MKRDLITNLHKSYWMRYHLDEHSVSLGNREEDLTIVQFCFASNLLSNSTHQPVEKANYKKIVEKQCHISLVLCFPLQQCEKSSAVI